MVVMQVAVSDNRYLATGRWLVLVFGAVLATAVAALGFAVPDDPRNLWIAIAAAAIGFSASTVVIVLGARIQLAGLSLGELTQAQTTAERDARIPDGSDEAERWRITAAAVPGGVLEHLWMNGTHSPGDLHTRLHSDIKPPPSTDEVTAMLRLAEEWDARRRFRPLVTATYIALPVTLAAVVTTAWGWRDTADTSTAPSPAHPLAVSIDLLSAPSTLGIDEGCVHEGRLDAIAIGGTRQKPLVIIPPGVDCAVSTAIEIAPTAGRVTYSARS